MDQWKALLVADSELDCCCYAARFGGRELDIVHCRFTLFAGCFNRLCITLVAVSHGMSCIVKHVKVWQI